MDIPSTVIGCSLLTCYLIGGGYSLQVLSYYCERISVFVSILVLVVYYCIGTVLVTHLYSTGILLFIFNF